jgi:hypothetical protein
MGVKQGREQVDCAAVRILHLRVALAPERFPWLLVHRIPSLLTAAALTASALAAPAAAAGGHDNPQLGGQPQLRIIDDTHAALQFAAGRLPRTKAGKIDAKITFVNGWRVSGLEPIGTHGNDIRYVARVTAARQLRDHEKLRVTFPLGDAMPVRRWSRSTSTAS